MRVPELKTLLQEYHLTPTKSFGQHFLCDDSVLEAISASVLGTKVLEIGPGPGCLTKYLLQVADRQVVMVEMDPKFQVLLGEKMPQAQWIHGDALQLDWSQYSGFSVVSNLPYNISVPVMLQYAQHAHHLESAVFMMQKEVADRVMAPIRTKDYGRLSVMMQTFLDIRWLMDVPPSAFWPKPAVDSSVLICTPKNPWPDISFKKLSSLVAQAFASRRQMLHHNVRISKETWLASGIDSRRRAETLETEEFALLLRTISDHTLPQEPDHVDQR